MAEDPSNRQFTRLQVAEASATLRAALDLAPERLGVAQLVAMLSDEIALLRAAGFGDERVASMLHEAIGAEVTAEGTIWMRCTSWNGTV